MSTIPNTYECSACTLSQSIQRPKCELCDEPNPNFINSIFESNAALDAAISMLNFQREDQVVQCFQCDYINIGSNIQICQGCGKNPSDAYSLSMNLPISIDGYSTNNETNSDDPNDEYKNEAFLIQKDVEQSQNNDESQQTVSTAEKEVDDKQLLPYFNQYISILKDQQQKAKSLNEDYLHDCMTNLFESLEYKNNPPNGQLTFSICQICCCEDQPMVTMKVNH